MKNETETVNCLSLLAEVIRGSRRLAPALADELAGLLGHMELSSIGPFADLAAAGMLARGVERDMIPAVIELCDLAIAAGTRTETDWEVAFDEDGGRRNVHVDHEVHSSEAQRLLVIRADLARVRDLVERIGDLLAAERELAMLRAEFRNANRTGA